MNATETHNLFSWQLPPSTQADQEALPKSVAFGLPEEAAAQSMPAWRIDFPADTSQAEQMIQGVQEQTARRQALLDGLPARLDELARRATAGGTSFATPIAPPKQVAGAFPEMIATGAPGADDDLLAGLAELSASQEKGISFGLTEKLGGSWEQAQAQFQGFTNRLERTLTNLAWVETRQAGQLIAQTVVGWSGDCDTLWEGAASPEQMALHLRSLEASLQSRLHLLSTFTLAVQGAVKLSLLVTTPGGVILALPLVWKYINQILAVR